MHFFHLFLVELSKAKKKNKKIESNTQIEQTSAKRTLTIVHDVNMQCDGRKPPSDDYIQRGIYTKKTDDHLQ